MLCILCIHFYDLFSCISSLFSIILVALLILWQCSEHVLLNLVTVYCGKHPCVFCLFCGMMLNPQSTNNTLAAGLDSSAASLGTVMTMHDS